MIENNEYKYSLILRDNLYKMVIVDTSFGFFGLYLPVDFKGYFFDFMNSIDEEWLPQWKQERVQRAKKIIAETKRLEALSLWESAETEIAKLIADPEVKKRRVKGY